MTSGGEPAHPAPMNLNSVVGGMSPHFSLEDLRVVLTSFICTQQGISQLPPRIEKAHVPGAIMPALLCRTHLEIL